MNERDFLKGLNLADERIRRGALQGMRKAVLALRTDSNEETPKVPTNWGDLKKSASVDAGEEGKGIVGQVGYNMVYAAYLHEGISRFTGNPLIYGYTRVEERGMPPAEGTGAKWLAKTMSERREKYMGIVAVVVRKSLGG